MKEFNKNIPISFVDLCKAFDFISRDVMFKILALCGIPHKIVDSIRAVCKYTK